MANYDVILLDADGTLLDYDSAQRESLTTTLGELGFDANDSVASLYDRINESYWQAFERGLITKEELSIRRFADLFEQIGLSADPLSANGRYIGHLSQAGHVLPGAVEFCAALAEHCVLAIATNGVDQVQRSRLARSGLMPFITHLIVSEEAGAAKPDKRFFTFAMAQCGHPDKS